MNVFIHKRVSFSRFSNVFILTLALILTGCGGDTDGGGSSKAEGGGGNTGGGDGGNPGCVAGVPTASYNISWDDLVDPNSIISGFKIYYGTNAQLSKLNATGSYTVPGTAMNNNHFFVPANFNLQTCTTYYLAVATLTVSGESQLSNPASILIE